MDSKKLLEGYREEMIREIRNVVGFNTVESEAKPNAPFGQGCADCLDYVLELGEKMGFKTHNCDHYAGHIEFGEGKELFGVLGHLDVVPVSQEGWIAPPFSGEVIGDKIYGRGTIDDKGPMMAALFALKALKDSGFQPKKRIRLIFGCDEESGMACMRYYLKHEEIPSMAISPDGDFPVINVEKGIYAMMVTPGGINDNVLEISAGSRINVVPDQCTAKVKKGVDTRYFAEEGVEVAECGEGLLLTSRGVAAHGAQPEKGVNATWAMFRALAKTFPSDATLRFVSEKIAADTHAVAWGFPFEDKESGKITVNIGTVKTENGVLVLGLDIRYPVTFTSEQLTEKMKENSPEGFRILGGHANKPLWVPEESELVQTLLNVYSDITHTEAHAIAIGGGTYSRMLPMCVAFGPMFPGDEMVEHMTNEYISIPRLMQMTQMYYEAFRRLC